MNYLRNNKSQFTSVDSFIIRMIPFTFFVLFFTLLVWPGSAFGGDINFLTDGNNNIWDIQTDGSILDGAMVNNAVDAYDGGHKLFVDDIAFPSDKNTSLNNRQVTIGPATMSGLNVTRKIFVPENKGYARFLEILENQGSSSISCLVTINSDLGSDSNTSIISTSSGDTNLSMSDTWLITDDSGGTDPYVTHIIAENSENLDSFNLSNSGHVNYSYNITILPGQTCIIMHFGMQCKNDQATSISMASATMKYETDNMSDSEKSNVVNFSLVNTNLPTLTRYQPDLTPYRFILASFNSSYAIKSNGSVWAWGGNYDGQLGLGDTINRNVPTQIEGLSDIVEISAYSSIVLALKSNGTVWAWGSCSNSSELYPLLVDGKQGLSSTPIQFPNLSDITAIASGRDSALMLKEDGTIWGWGLNNIILRFNSYVISTPRKIEGISDVVKLSVGSHHALALKSDGTVWAWGYGGQGALGFSSTYNVYAPSQVPNLSNVIDIYAEGGYYSFALTDKGQLYRWGGCHQGECDRNGSLEPKILTDRDGEPYCMKAIFSSYVGMKCDGSVYNFWNHFQIPDATWMSSTSGHDLILKPDGTLMGSGYNSYGQLGDGTVIDSNDIQNPVKVIFPGGASISVNQIVADSNAAPGSKDHILLSLKLTVDDIQENTLNSITVRTGGSYLNSDIENFSLFYSTDDSLDSNDTELSTKPVESTGNNIVFSHLNKKIGAGVTGYLFIITDISTTAGGGRTIHLTRSPLSNIELLDGNVTGETNEIPDSGVQTFISSSVKISSLSLSENTANNGTVNYPLYLLQLDVTTIAADLKGIKIVTTGNYETSDISQFNLYYSTDKTLSSTDTLLDTNISTASGSTIDFSGFNQLIETDKTGYLFISADIADRVDPTHTIGINTVPTSNLVFTADPTRSGTTSDGIIHTLYMPSEITVSSPFVTAAGVIQGTADHLIYRIKLDVSDNKAILTGLSLITGGSYSTSDIDNFKLYYSTDNIHDAADTLLNKQSTPSSSKNVIFTGFSKLLNPETVGYLFVTIDVNLEAEGGKTVYIAQTPVSNFQFQDLDSVVNGDMTKSGIQNFPLSPYISAGIGFYHTVALKSNGLVWTWGNNADGQLGDGTTDDSVIAIRNINLNHVTAVNAGHYFSLALTANGIVYAWGENDYGQLGNGSNVNGFNPVQVTGLTNIIKVNGGGNHAIALKNDGTVWAWGSNRYGQLGDGTNINSSTPIRVSGLDSVISVVAGGDFSMALKSDGTVWAWGLNDFGQLGINSTTNHSLPQQLPLTNVKEIAAGEYHALALLETNGTVMAWGGNKEGRVGNGTTDNQLSPVNVSGPATGNLTSITHITAGNRHSLALKSDGTVYAWGWNNYGQIGDASNTDRTLPVQVSGLSSVVDIYAGGDYSLARKLDGTLVGWGHNQYGQLGDGTVDNRNQAVQGGVIPIVTVSSASVGPEIMQRGGTNQLLYRFDLSVDEANAALEGLILITDGDYQESDLDENGFKLRYSADDHLDNEETDPVLAQVDSASSGSKLFFSDFSRQILLGTTGYFFVTVDINPEAVGGRKIGIAENPFNNIIISGKSYLLTGVEPVPAGDKKVIPVVSVTITTTEVPDGNAVQQQKNHILYQLNFSIDAENTLFTGITMKTQGNYTIQDLLPESFKLYYSLNNTLETSDALLDTHEIVRGGRDIVFTGFSQKIVAGTPVYLFVTADISPTAGGNRFISIQDIDIENITFTEKYLFKIGDNPLTGGGIQTFPVSSITVTAPTVPDSTVLQAAKNMLLYRFDLSATSADSIFTGVTLKTTGSYEISDIEKWKIIYSEDNVLDTSDHVLSTKTEVIPSDTKTDENTNNLLIFNNFSQIIARDKISHFFITADMTQKAIVRNVSIKEMKLEDLVFKDLVSLLPQDTTTMPSGGVQTFPTPKITVTSPTVNAATVEQNTSNHILYRMNIAVSDANVNLNTLRFITGGSYQVSDIEQFKLIMSNNNSLSSDDKELARFSTVASGSSLEFVNLSEQLIKGQTAYLFVTADIGPANGARTVFIAQTAINQLVFENNDLIVKSGTDPMAVGGTQTFPIPTIVVSSPAVPAETIEQDTTNCVIYRLNIDASRAEAVLKNLNLKTSGTYLSSDLVPNSFKLWYSSDSMLEESDTVIKTSDFVAPGETLIFSDIFKTIKKGTIGYIFVTVDIGAANGGRTLNINATPLNQIVFSYGDVSGTTSVGGIKTFPIPYITVKAPTVYSMEVPQETTDHVLYRINFSVEKAEAILNGLTIKTGGTYIASDLVPDSFKLRCSDNAILNSGDAVLSSQSIVASGNNLTFNGLSKKIAKGSTVYLFITVDIGEAIGRNIYIHPTDFNQIAFEFANFSGSNPVAAGGVQRFPVPLIEMTAPEVPSTQKVEQGTINYLLYEAALNVSKANAVLTNLKFTTSGTYRPSDISSDCSSLENCTPAIEKTMPVFKLIFSDDPVMDNDDIVMSEKKVALSGSDIVFNNLSQIIPKNTTGYLFLTANIGPAVGGRTIYIKSVPFANFTFEFSEKTGVNPLPASGVHTFAEAPENVLDLDGIDDYIDIPYVSTLNPGQFTISLKAKVEGNSETRRVAISTIDEAHYAGYEIYADVDNKWKIRIGTGTSWVIVQGPEIKEFTWYDLSGTYDGKGLKFYVNGELFTQGGTAPQFVANSVNNLMIGQQTNGNNHFNGQLDEITIWNIARTQNEIIHSINNPPTDNETGIVAHYRFDPWGTLSDSTSFGNDGSMFGDPKWALEHAGLWIGQIEINQVNETMNPEPQDVANPFDMRILIHVDATGEARLLKEVTMMKKTYTVEENDETLDMADIVLLTDNSLLSEYKGVVRRDGKLVGIRLSSLLFEFDPPDVNDLRMNGKIREGSTLSAKLELSATHPNNPFRHVYHPDHKEGRKIFRKIALTIDTPDINDPKSGVFKFVGDYYETIEGLHKAPIKLKGRFSLDKVSGVLTLNDNE